MSDKVSGVGGDDNNNSVEEESHELTVKIPFQMSQMLLTPCLI